jgi:hypothetical protein
MFKTAFGENFTEKTQSFEWSSQFEPEEASAKDYQSLSPPSTGRTVGNGRNVHKTDKTDQQIVSFVLNMPAKQLMTEYIHTLKNIFRQH